MYLGKTRQVLSDSLYRIFQYYHMRDEYFVEVNMPIATISQSSLHMKHKKDNPFNVSYADWTEKWWQWAYSLPQNIHPAYDNTGKFCKESQKEPVWFFPGTYQQSVIRYCEIPYGVGILFPILNSECSFVEYPQMKTKEELSNCARKIQDTTVPV